MSDADPRLRPRGSNHVGMRQFNERVVLQAIRLHGALPKADIARLTKLTAQTVQLIIGRLERDGLVRKEAPLRGKVGQPSVPMALNPDDAFSIGIQIGRRSLDMMLVDFAGQARERLSLSHAFPDPDALFGEISARLAQLTRAIGPAGAQALHGIGVSAPFSLGGWQKLLGPAAAIAGKWAEIDIRASIAAMNVDVPVMFVKDTAAACVAELVVGRGRSVRSYLYVFVGTFIGGGLVIDSHLHAGRTGNAGAIGSLPLTAAPAQHPGLPEQLLGVASLFMLEARYVDAKLDPDAALDDRALQPPWARHTEEWLKASAAAMAMAINSAACLLDLDAVIVDGAFGRALLDALLSELETALHRHNWEGVDRPPVWPGTIGAEARALGGALLPLYANFAPDRDLFLKLEA